MSKKDSTFTGEEAWKILHAIIKEAEESYIGEERYLSAFKLGYLESRFAFIIVTLNKKKYERELTKYLNE
jgi:hypothetical protein